MTHSQPISLLWFTSCAVCYQPVEDPLNTKGTSGHQAWSAGSRRQSENCLDLSTCHRRAGPKVSW